MTGPAMTHLEFRALVDIISETNTKHDDGKVLASLVEMIYYCGLKRKEVIALRLKDVMTDIRHNNRQITQYTIADEISSISKRISGTNYPVLIIGKAKARIKSHLQYLLANEKYNHRPGSPLFPRRNKKYYTVATVNKQLSQFNSQVHLQSGALINTENIRQSGKF